MRFPRLNNPGMMAVIMGLALWFAALRRRSSLGSDLVVLATVLALVVASLIARFGRSPTRDWWFC